MHIAHFGKEAKNGPGRDGSPHYNYFCGLHCPYSVLCNSASGIGAVGFLGGGQNMLSYHFDAE